LIYIVSPKLSLVVYNVSFQKLICPNNSAFASTGIGGLLHDWIIICSVY